MHKFKVGDWVIWLDERLPLCVVRLDGNVIWLDFRPQLGAQECGVHHTHCRPATQLEKLLYT